MKTLTIDIGNTRRKYDFWDDDGFIFRREIPDTEALVEEIKRESVEGVIVSSVNEHPEELVETLKRHTKCRVVNFNNQEIEKYGDKIHYKGNVGADRIAAFLGAEDLVPGNAMLVVDMGTAMTLDVADNRGTYRGGNISLGFHSRLKALASSARLLPEIENTGVYISFGNDTLSSIQSGAINGVLGEIRYAALRAEKEFDIKKTIFTGGDSEWFYFMLNKDLDCLMDPYLVGRGLNRHLRMYYFGNSE